MQLPSSAEDVANRQTAPLRRATTRRATDLCPALRAHRGVRRVIGDDAKGDRRAGGVDVGDHAGALRSARRAVVIGASHTILLG